MRDNGVSAYGRIGTIDAKEHFVKEDEAARDRRKHAPLL